MTKYAQSVAIIDTQRAVQFPCHLLHRGIASRVSRNWPGEYIKTVLLFDIAISLITLYTRFDSNVGENSRRSSLCKIVMDDTEEDDLFKGNNGRKIKAKFVMLIKWV